MYRKTKQIIFAILISIIFSKGGYVFGQAVTEKDIQKIDRLVIFPFENISGNFDAPKVINSLLESEFRNKGFQIVPYREVDRFLTKRKIRYTGFVDKITALELNREFGADAVIIGSINEYSNGNDEIYAGLSLRLVRTEDCSIIWIDTVSYAGSDFAGLLGLGRVRSLDRLCEVVVVNIVGKIPREYIFEERERNPFEIGDLKISPLIIRGAKTTKVSVRIIPITEEPVIVLSQIGGKVFALRNKNGDYYDGEFTAPLVDGLYPIDIVASVPNGKIYKFSSAGVIKVDTLPPQVAISTDKDVTAGMLKKDGIIFTLNSNEAVERWKVEIVDKQNKYVRGGRGFGLLPKQLIWRGENDEGGRNDDGVYNLKLSVWDAVGNVGVFKKEIRLDTTPPAVKIYAEILANGNVVFNIDYEKEEMIDKWEFAVIGENSEIIKEINGRGNVDKRIVVSLPYREKVLDSRNIIYTFKAIDKAGNIFQPPNQTNIIAKRISGWGKDF